VKHYSNFDRDPIAREVVQADNRLVEGTLSLNDVIVLGVHIGVERDSEHEVRVSDGPESLGEFVVEEQSPVSEDMQSRSGQSALAALYNLQEVIPK